jgi:putative endonuclease
VSAARWHVYLVRCGDGALYTGVTTDVARRIEEHRRGGARGAKRLRGRAPLRLVASRPVGGRGPALRVERRIKRLSKSGKEALVARPGALAAMLAEVRGGPARRRARPRSAP